MLPGQMPELEEAKRIICDLQKEILELKEEVKYGMKIKEQFDRMTKLQIPWWVKLALKFKSNHKIRDDFYFILDDSNKKMYCMGDLLNGRVRSSGQFLLFLYYLFPKFFDDRQKQKAIEHIERVNNINMEEYGLEFKVLKKDSHLLSEYIGRLSKPEYMIPKTIKNIAKIEDFRGSDDGMERAIAYLDGISGFPIIELESEYELYVLKEGRSKHYRMSKITARFLMIATIVGLLIAGFSAYYDKKSYEVSINNLIK